MRNILAKYFSIPASRRGEAFYFTAMLMWKIISSYLQNHL